MTAEQTTRYAAVRGRDLKRETLERYLPDNYKIVYVPDGYYGDDEFIIEGHDVAGWTLDGYVIPRLRSGNMGAKELYQWLEDDGDAESGPHLSAWLEDEPQTSEAMARKRREAEEEAWEHNTEVKNR